MQQGTHVLASNKSPTEKSVLHSYEILDVEPETSENKITEKPSARPPPNRTSNHARASGWIDGGRNSSRAILDAGHSHVTYGLIDRSGGRRTRA